MNEKTTTLGQAIKILSQIDGLPRNQVQTAIESGVFPELIRTGELSEAKRAQEIEVIKKSWELIWRLTRFEGIIITVPHDYCQHRSAGEQTVFQLRCWKDTHGYLEKGHVDGGVDLFEVMLTTPLEECPCCWKDTLARFGIDVYGGENGEWVKEVVIAHDRSDHDIITYKKK